MSKISDVIRKLEELKEKHGDIEVMTVDYHSDFHDSQIENIDDAITFSFSNYVLIGGDLRR